jgi:hypothetical protein
MRFESDDDDGEAQGLRQKNNGEEMQTRAYGSGFIRG